MGISCQAVGQNWHCGAASYKNCRSELSILAFLQKDNRLKKLKNQLRELLINDKNLDKAELQAYKDMSIENLYNLERIDKPYDSFQIFTAL